MSGNVCLSHSLSLRAVVNSALWVLAFGLWRRSGGIDGSTLSLDRPSGESRCGQLEDSTRLVIRDTRYNVRGATERVHAYHAVGNSTSRPTAESEPAPGASLPREQQPHVVGPGVLRLVRHASRGGLLLIVEPRDYYRLLRASAIHCSMRRCCVGTTGCAGY